jgi:hypothetical protein
MSNRLLAIASRLPRYDLAALANGVESRRKAFANACFVRNECLDLSTIIAIPRLATDFEEMCLAYAFQTPAPQQLATSLELYAAYGNLVARSQKAFARVVARRDFYTDRLEDLGMWTLAAIHAAADTPARWLCAEFLRHLQAGEKGEASYDDSFLETVAYIARWYVTGEVPHESPRCNPHFVAIATAAKAREPDSFLVSLARYADWRESESSRLIRHGSVRHENYFCETFCALFPLEIPVVLRLFSPEECLTTFATPPWLSGLVFPGTSWRDEFIIRAGATFDSLAP